MHKCEIKLFAGHWNWERNLNPHIYFISIFLWEISSLHLRWETRYISEQLNQKRKHLLKALRPDMPRNKFIYFMTGCLILWSVVWEKSFTIRYLISPLFNALLKNWSAFWESLRVFDLLELEKIISYLNKDISSCRTDN